MSYGQISDEIKAMDRETLEAYAGSLEYLDESRVRLFEVIPDCPAHGSGCVPYAVAWITKAYDAGITLNEDEIPTLDAEQQAEVQAAFDTLSR